MALRVAPVTAMPSANNSCASATVIVTAPLVEAMLLYPAA